MDTICFIHLPDDFNERYRKYRERLLEDEPQKMSSNASEESLNLKSDAVTTPKGDRKPCTTVEKGKGYFKFFKEGEKIEIGGAATRPFLLIQCLCNPFGAWKAVEEVFTASRLPSDENDSRLKEWLPDKQDRMKQIIKNSGIKELQKIKQLQGELSYEWGSNETKLRLKLEE